MERARVRDLRAPFAVRVSSTSFADSSPKNQNVPCSFTGHQVVGLGGEVLNGGQEVVLDRLRPDPPNNALATAFEDEGGFAGNWQLGANAVCATPFAGQETVSAPTAENSVAAKGITASCPGAKRAIGAAAEVTNGLGQVFLTALRPLADLTGVSAFAVEDETGTNASWGLVARAICADPPPGLERVSATGPLDSQTTKSATMVLLAPPVRGSWLQASISRARWDKCSCGPRAPTGCSPRRRRPGPRTPMGSRSTGP